MQKLRKESEISDRLLRSERAADVAREFWGLGWGRFRARAPKKRTRSTQRARTGRDPLRRVVLVRREVGQQRDRGGGMREWSGGGV